MRIRRSAAALFAISVLVSCGASDTDTDSDSGSQPDSPAGQAIADDAGESPEATEPASAPSVRLAINGEAWDLQGSCTVVEGGQLQASYVGHEGTRSFDLYQLGSPGPLVFSLLSDELSATVNADDWDGSSGGGPESMQIDLVGGELTITGSVYTGTFDNQTFAIDFVAGCQSGAATEGDQVEVSGGDPVADLCALLSDDELAALPLRIAAEGSWQPEGTTVDPRGDTRCRWVLANNENPLLSDLSATVFEPGVYEIGDHLQPRTGISADHPVEILDDPAGAVYAGNVEGDTHYVRLVYGDTYLELRQGLMVIPNDELLATALALLDRLPG